MCRFVCSFAYLLERAGAYPGRRLKNRLAVERIEPNGDSLRRIFPDTAFDVGLALLCFGSGSEAIEGAEGYQGPSLTSSALRQCESSHRREIDFDRCSLRIVHLAYLQKKVESRSLSRQEARWVSCKKTCLVCPSRQHYQS